MLGSRKPEVSLTGLAKVITVVRRVMLDMGSSPEQVGKATRNILNTCGFALPDFKRARLLELVDFFQQYDDYNWAPENRNGKNERQESVSLNMG